MAARPNPSPNKAPRRKQGPLMPGSLILMLMFAALIVGMYVYPLTAAKTIEYSDFLKLVELKLVKKLNFVGKERATGDVKDEAKDNEFIKSLALPGGKFNVSLPPANDRQPFADDIYKRDAEVKITFEEDHGAWVGPLLTTLLMTMILLGILFLFVLPRFRDPLGEIGRAHV